MPQTVKLQAVNATTSDNKIHGIANSLTMSRSGDLITKEAVEPVIGQKVPLLMSHDWSSMPIGEATMTGIDETGLLYEGLVFDSVPNKDQILQGINSGVLFVSVGLQVESFDSEGAITGMDLLELSITPVPADSHATITQQLKEQNMEQETETQAEATIDDVLTAIGDLSAKVDDVLKAVTPAEEEPAEDAPTPDSEPATQSLDELVKLVQGLDIQDPMTAFKINKAIANI